MKFYNKIKKMFVGFLKFIKKTYITYPIYICVYILYKTNVLPSFIIATIILITNLFITYGLYKKGD